MQTLMIWLLGSLLCITHYAQASAGIEQIHVAMIDDVPSTPLATLLMEHAYARLGIELHTHSLPSRRALQDANRGKFDGDLFRIAKVAEQYPNLIRVDYPLLQGELYAIVLDSQVTALPKPTNRRLTVGVRRGIFIAEQAAKNLGMNPIRTESYDNIRLLIEHGRVDLGLVSDIAGLGPFRQPHWQHLNIIKDPVTEFTLYHYLHQRHNQLAKDIAIVLKEMEQDGTKARLVQSMRSELTTN